MDEELEQPKTDYNIADADEFERSSLDAPEGRYLFTLDGVYGQKETSGGKPYLSALYRLDREAIYDAAGNLERQDDLERPYRVFVKFYIGSDYGNKFLGSWLDTVGVRRQGKLDPTTGRYVFLKDEALASTIGKSAWNAVRHKVSTYQGERRWELSLNQQWYKNPAKHVKVDEGETA